MYTCIEIHGISGGLILLMITFLILILGFIMNRVAILSFML